MIAASERARQFWSAAFFLRRAIHRDPQLAIRVLAHVARNSTGEVQRRAATMLREIENGKRRSTHEG